MTVVGTEEFLDLQETFESKMFYYGLLADDD